MSFLSKNHDRLVLAIKAAHSGVLDLDVRSGTLYISPEFKQLFGYRDEQIPDRKALMGLIHPDDLAVTQAIDQHTTDTQRSTYSLRFRIRNHSGQWRWGEAQCIQQLNAAGECIRIVRTVTDATRQILLEGINSAHLLSGRFLQQARTNNELYALFFKVLNQIFNIDEMLMAASSTDDAPHDLLYFTSSRHVDEAAPQRLERCRALLRQLQPHQRPLHLFRNDQEAHQLPGTPSELLLAVPLQTDDLRDGVLLVEYFHADYIFDPVHIEMLQSISEHLSLGRQKICNIQQLTHQAHHDPLTGLINRQALQDELTRLAPTLADPDRSAALLLIDLNRFKPVNDCYGHIVGDKLLKCIADRMREVFDGFDAQICRWAGDEFVIVLHDVTPQTALLIAETIRHTIASPYSINQRSIFVSASIGILHIDRPFDDIFHLIRCADMAMYQAKKSGNPEGGVYDFNDLPQEKLLDFRWMENDLHQAIPRDEFVLRYQPLVDPATGEVRGLEALVRWIHSKHGEIAPDRFIPVAEESGIIADLGIFVLQQACMDAVELLEQFPDLARHRVVSVNVSPRQLYLPNFAGEVKQILEISDCPSQLLNLEITESSLMENPAEAIRMIHQLKELGVGITIDDFGTGYAALSYLAELPVDAIKIDRRFIKDMDPRNAIIVRNIITLATELELKVTVEGIETEEQLQAVHEMGCNLVQGYFISRPQELPATITFIQNQLSAS